MSYLKLVIQSIEKNTYYQDYEVLIYSEGSTDGTEEYLKKEFTGDKNCKFWCKPEKWNLKYHGIGGGLNFLAEKVKTPYIIFMHSDMYGGPEFDRPLIENIKDGVVISAHRIEPDIFGNKIPEYEVRAVRPGTLSVHKDYFGYTYDNFDVELFDSFSNQFTYNNVKSYPKGEGAGGFIITKHDWDLIGGCDPLFSPASFEDADVFIRAQLKGIKFILTCKSLIFHFGARGSIFQNDDFSKRSERQIECEKINAVKWLTKWNKMFKYDNYGFFSATGMEIIDDKNEYR